jgi:hypothetical protein
MGMHAIVYILCTHSVVVVSLVSHVFSFLTLLVLLLMTTRLGGERQ